MDIDVVMEIVEELRKRGTIYCESISAHEWKRRGWPADRGTFNLVDALLKAYRELDKRDFDGIIRISKR